MAGDPLDTLTTITIGGQTSLDEALGFFANSVYVENYSNQWVSLPDIVAFIPPYTSRLLALQGVQKAKFLFGAPPGTTQVATIAGQICNARWSQVTVPATGGPVGPIGVTSNYYDRNPLSIAFRFANSAFGPGSGTGFTYTAPANRKAFVEVAETYVMLNAAGDLAAGGAFSDIRVTPLAGVATDMILAIVTNLFPAFVVEKAIVGASIELQPGEIIDAIIGNTYTATTASIRASLKLTEFDA